MRMKTPDAIKKGLGYCYPGRCYGSETCPYVAHGTACENRLREDALALIRQLEEALLLMVYQYCDEGDSVNHRFMTAGEHAFAALGIENGCSIEQIEKMLDEMERGGEVG